MEDDIIKYALNFLLSNLDENNLDDLGGIMGKDDHEEIENDFAEFVEHF